ncbi:MAG: hypothetical protein QF464_04320, partial [Myxococcota bacterium]|nr:hypothetical protein [Myxococcota bacterium]
MATTVVDPVDIPTTEEPLGDVVGDVTFGSAEGPVDVADVIDAAEDVTGDALDVREDVAAEVTGEPECEPNTFCMAGVAGMCTTAGLWQPSQDCGAEGLLCVGGTCRSPCEVETDDEGLAGCDHWGVGLGHGDDGPFAFAALNVATVHVTVAVWGQVDAASEPTVFGSATLAPGEARAFDLGAAQTDAPGVHWQGWRLRATGPVIAYQHSPLAGLEASSGDGSLLLPAQGMGHEFIAIGRPEGRALDGTARRATLTVVAAEAGTNVKITPAVPLLAGDDLGTLAASDEASVSLQPHQVLHLTTTSERDDLSGTVVFSTHPVAVFTG